MKSHRNKKRGPDESDPLKVYCIKTLFLRFIQRQNDGDSRSDIGQENSNQQANKPLEVAVDSILDIRKTAVHVVQSAVNAIVHVAQSIVDTVQSVVDLFNNCFQNGDSAFNGGNVHNVSSVVYSVLRVLST